MTRVWVSMILASVACGANLWATFHCRPSMRPSYAFVAILAGIYSVAYVALITGAKIWVLDGSDRGAWSQTLAPVAFLVWPLVWTIPAIRETRHERALVAAANRAIDDQLTDGNETQ